MLQNAKKKIETHYDGDVKDTSSITCFTMGGSDSKPSNDAFLLLIIDKNLEKKRISNNSRLICFRLIKNENNA
jgi:hypothetical protein